MVLHGQPCGRVGRRRDFLQKGSKPKASGFFLLCFTCTLANSNLPRGGTRKAPSPVHLDRLFLRCFRAPGPPCPRLHARSRAAPRSVHSQRDRGEEATTFAPRMVFGAYLARSGVCAHRALLRRSASDSSCRSGDSAGHAGPQKRAVSSAHLWRANSTSDELRTMRAVACRDRVGGGGRSRPAVWHAARFAGEASRSERDPSSADGLGLQSGLLSVTRRLRTPFGRRLGSQAGPRSCRRAVPRCRRLCLKHGEARDLGGRSL